MHMIFIVYWRMVYKNYTVEYNIISMNLLTSDSEQISYFL